MGGVASSVGNAVSGVGQAIGNITSGAVHAVEGVASSVGHTLESVGKGITSDPIGTIAKVAAIATQQYWALPLISAATVVAHGGNLGQAALAAGVSYATMALAAGVSEAISSALTTPAMDSVSSMATADAVSQVTQNIPVDQISSTLQQSYNLAPELADSMANAASAGVPQATLASAYAGAYGSALNGVIDTSANAILATAGGNAAANFAKTLVTTGDIKQAFTSGASSGIGSYLGQSVGSEIGGTAGNIIGTATGAATASAIQGKDAGQTFINSLINTTLAQGGSQIKQIWSSANATADQYNQKLNETQNLYQNEVLPAQQNAQELQNTAKSSYDSYKSVANQFGDLTKQYDDAKAAGNTELANSLADQANALIPQLNAATDKYNADATSYQTSLDKYNTLNDKLQANSDQLGSLQTQYKAADAQLQRSVQEVSEAGAKVADMSDVAKTAFTSGLATGSDTNTVLENATKINDMGEVAQKGFSNALSQTNDYAKALDIANTVNELPKNQQNYFQFATDFGLSATDAASLTPTISGMSNIAQQTFFDNLRQNPDINVALNTANTVNGLNTDQQNAFYVAKLNGLTQDQALQVAPEIAGVSSEIQKTYLDTIKATGSVELAQLFGAAQSLVPNQTKAVDVNAAFANLNDDQKQIATMSMLSGNNLDQALKAASDFLISPAQAEPSMVDPTKNVTLTGTYKDLGNGNWQVVGKDATGNEVSLSSPFLLSSGNKPLESGEVAGQYTYNPTAPTDANGLPTAKPVTPTETGAPTSTSTNTDLTAGMTDAEKTQYEAELTAQKAKDDANLKIVDTQPTPSTTGSVSSPAQDPMLQYINDLFTGNKTSKIASNAPTTSTVGGQTSGGTNAGTTGTVGGASTGSGDGTGAGTGNTGTGVGTSGTGTGGTGTGGTGTGVTGVGIGGLGLGASGTGTGYNYNTASTGNDIYGGIQNLTPGLTKTADYTLSGIPNIQETTNPMYNIPSFASGGSTDLNSSSYDPYATDTGSNSLIKGSLMPGLTKAQLNYILTGLPGSLIGKAEGGAIDSAAPEGHNPSFYSEGGLEHTYVKGEGDGTSDSVAAMLANGEFVIPADVVSNLGNGSNDAGAEVLSEFLAVIRGHKQDHNPKNLPPESKGPLAYLLQAQKKVKA